MIIADWLKQATSQLFSAGISSAELDCLILLEDLLGNDRAHILAHTEDKLSDSQLKLLKAQLKRRVLHEPLSYIRGKSNFYGREFLVNQHTLEPRPETETMIEMLLSLDLKKPNIIDIGTGSGCLAITAKLQMPHANVRATDISPECLEMARQNAKNLRAEVELYECNLLPPLSNILNPKSYILLCNLPYVPDDWQINQAAIHEPRLAIFGGPDGLDLYRQLFDQINQRRCRLELIFTESLPPQHDKLKAIANKHDYHLMKSQDFIQVFEHRI